VRSLKDLKWFVPYTLASIDSKGDGGEEKSGAEFWENGKGSRVELDKAQGRMAKNSYRVNK
jgi:hypothetical protein